jgi:hypothetical protein
MTYAYNGDGTLVSQATSGVTTRSTQDLAVPLSQVLQTKVGAAAITDYLYGLNRLASLNSGVKMWPLCAFVDHAAYAQGNLAYHDWHMHPGFFTHRRNCNRRVDIHHLGLREWRVVVMQN